jgi:hypothetical protein
VRQERRHGVELTQRRRVDLGDDRGVKAVDTRVFEVDRLVESTYGRGRDGDVQKVVRNELEELERLELALYAERGALDLRRRLDHPDLAVERAAGELVVEALERLAPCEERVPRVVERREVLAQGYAREM